MGKNCNYDMQIVDINDEVLRAVYALNMCTVSVSQIIDYNDAYILEQEYEMILNNLNLENIPKAEALKKILVELLNTITFFRIQEIRKSEIDKEYQKRVKNAIWSAIPNMNMIVSGNPVAIALSVATQVGIGYMNYRREKANALSEKEKKDLELQITALEQFHALRRELFTTAWELAEEYNFEDRLRLTEKQIKQYNQILMDQNELRKYARLEAIQNNFEAFPPFWYHLGHTACYIAGDKSLKLDKKSIDSYRERAKKYFEHYEKLNRFNILREDQMTAAFALEYADLLMEDKGDPTKISELISIANNMCGTEWDIKQLCVLAYLKIGETSKAATLLKQLVNEEYNTLTNAKLLSRIYVSQVLKENNEEARTEYKILVSRVGQDNEDLLYPMPNSERMEDDTILLKKYMAEVKTSLVADYLDAITSLMKKYTVRFNEVIPAPYGNDYYKDYYAYSEKAYERRLKDMEIILSDKRNRESYLDELATVEYRFKFLDIINEALLAYDELELWKESKVHSEYVESVKSSIELKKETMKDIHDKIVNRKFSIEDYRKLQEELSFRRMLDKMFDGLKETVVEEINGMEKCEQLENAENNLMVFCQKHEITFVDSPEVGKNAEDEIRGYIEYKLLGKEGSYAKYENELLKYKRTLVKDAAEGLIKDKSQGLGVLLPNDKAFDLYFKNREFKAGSLKEKTLAIIADNSKKKVDILLARNTLITIKRNRIKAYYSYNSISYKANNRLGECLVMGIDEFSDRQINIGALYNLIEKLRNAENDVKSKQ